MEQLEQLWGVLCKSERRCHKAPSKAQDAVFLRSELCRLSMKGSLNSPDVKPKPVYERKDAKPRRKAKVFVWISTGGLWKENVSWV